MKIILKAFFLMTFVLVSCKSTTETSQSTSKQYVSPKEVGKDLCTCTEQEGENKTKCLDEFVEKYKGAIFKEEDEEKMVKVLTKCAGRDMEALEALSRLE